MKKQTIKMTGTSHYLWDAKERRIYFELGKVAFGQYSRDGKKRNLIVVEWTMTDFHDDDGKHTSSLNHLTADVWNAHKTDLVMCGQILDEFLKKEIFDQLTEDAQKIVTKLNAIWKEFHLAEPTSHISAMFNTLFAMTQIGADDVKAILNVLESKEF